MSVTIQQLGIDQLSVTDRLNLIDQIWDSLPEQMSPDDVPAWHLVEIAKRVADASPTSGKPWREVLDQITSRS